MNDAHPTPTDAMFTAAYDAFLTSKATSTARQLKEALQAALAHQHQDAEVVGWVYYKELESGASTTAYRSEPDKHLLNLGFTERPLTYADTTAWNANMDEAPRDGTEVLLFYPLEGLSEIHPKTVVACWRNDSWVFQSRAFRGYSEAYQPTHWQHLPQPPKEQG